MGPELISLAAPLDLSPKSMVPDQLLSPAGSPYLGTPHLTSLPGSPLIVGPSQDAKHSWFSNLFSWKPAVSFISIRNRTLADKLDVHPHLC